MHDGGGLPLQARFKEPVPVIFPSPHCSPKIDDTGSRGGGGEVLGQEQTLRERPGSPWCGAGGAAALMQISAGMFHSKQGEAKANKANTHSSMLTFVSMLTVRPQRGWSCMWTPDQLYFKAVLYRKRFSSL